jgi:peroxiredoxin
MRSEKSELMKPLLSSPDQLSTHQSTDRQRRGSAVWLKYMAPLLVLATVLAIALVRTRDDVASEPEDGPSRPEIGFTAPDFTLETLDGETVRLAKLRGQVVLINFWATWCRPCRDEMPAIQEAYDRHRDEGLTVLAVSVMESDTQVTDFVKEMELTFPISIDRYGSVSERYRTRSIPSSYFVDRSGVIQHVVVAGPMRSSEVESQLADLLVQNENE